MSTNKIKIKRYLHLSTSIPTLIYLLYGIFQGPKNNGKYTLHDGQSIFIDKGEFLIIISIGCVLVAFACWILYKCAVVLSSIDSGVSKQKKWVFIAPTLVNMTGAIVYVFAKTDEYDAKFWLAVSTAHLLVSL